MSSYKILNKQYLRFLWVADPKWHSIISAGISTITFLFDLMFSGRRSIYKLMRRLKENSNNEIPDYANLRFCYLYHYYTARTIYNYGWLLYSKAENIKKAMKQVEIIGLDNFQQALSSDKGMVIFSAHVGCIFNMVFCERIIKITNDRKVVLLSPENKEKRKKLIKNQVRRTFPGFNFDLIDITIKSDAIKIFSTLKKKGIVGCTLDYAYPFTKNKIIKFFGRQVEFPLGLIEIGRKVGVTYLPCFSYIKNGQITIEFMEPFPSIRSENKEKDISAISMKINDILEKKILEIPEQWNFWLRLYCSEPAKKASAS